MNTTLPTQGEAHSRDAVYWGDHRDWVIADTKHRDSDALGRSNFRTMKAALESLDEVKNWKGEEAPVQEEESSHWAVGWVLRLIVDPACEAAVKRAQELNEALEDYPVLDETDFSSEEQEEADQTWKNCYNSSERIEYIRKHRSQFEFRDFADLLSCVRGNYFTGYASELLH